MLERRSHLLYHPQAESPVPVPLFCRSVNRSVMRQGETSQYVAKDYWHLFWLVDGTSELRFEDRTETLGPGQAVLIEAGVRRQSVCTSETSFAFGASVIGELMPGIAASLGYAYPGITTPGAFPADLFLQLEESISDISGRGVRQASGLFYQILLRLFSRDDCEVRGTPSAGAPSS